MSEIFPNVNTTLDLNGPTLVFTENPVGVAITHTGSATLTGIVTAVFPEGQTDRATNTGSINLQWYRRINGIDFALVDGVNSNLSSIVASGTTTTTLSLSNIQNPQYAQAEFFLRADYIPSAYENGRTGNAVIDPQDSNVGIITTKPLITITSLSADPAVGENQQVSVSVGANITDNSGLSYQWRINGQVRQGDWIGSTTTPTLTFTTGNQFNQNIGIGSHALNVTITNPNADPPQVVSNDIILNVVSARSILAYELVDSTWNGGGSKDLVNQGFLEFDANDSDERSICIYPTEKDIDVLITMGGSKGDAKNGNRGGEGGLSSFRLTLNQNEEYFIRLGVPQSVGINDFGGIVGGGGASIFHRRANIVAVCGGGGGGGQSNRGGDGGGVNLAGEDGVGRNGGNGGVRFNIGELDDVGSYAKTVNFNNTTSWTNSALNIVGGKLSTCTPGVYWANQGYSQCQNLGSVKYRTAGGTVITQTAQIDRGFKQGGNFRRNGGNGSGNQGGGGAGVEGGSAALSDGSGGGGGSGYSNGEINIISASVGGNNDYGYIKIEDYGTTI